MTLRNFSALTCVVGIITVSTVQARKGAVEDMQFRSRYGNMHSVSCTFTDVSGLTYEIKAQKGGKYRLTAPDREIICDGKTVWNVTPSSKTVIINSYVSTSEDVSIERVFFLILNIYTPKVISSNAKSIVLQLTPPRQDATVANVTDAVISMNGKYDISQIKVTENGSTTTWQIRKLLSNPKLPAKTFTYTVAKDYQAVDLR